MRIVIDMQGAQTGSRKRGIGRHTLGIATALARNPGAHEIWLALNARWPDASAAIRAAFGALVPPERIRGFDAPAPFAERYAEAGHVRAAELIRERFLAGLAPDVVFVPSLFEGWDGDATASIGGLAAHPTAVTLHDLIPGVRPHEYLPDLPLRQYYARKLESLRRADLVLAVSEHTRATAITLFGLPAERVRVVANGVEPRFRPRALDAAERQALLRRHGLERPFVLFVGAPTACWSSSTGSIRRMRAGPPAPDTSARSTACCAPSARSRVRASLKQQVVGSAAFYRHKRNAISIRVPAALLAGEDAAVFAFEFPDAAFPPPPNSLDDPRKLAIGLISATLSY